MSSSLIIILLINIPQIDWTNIHINQKALWDQGLYDEAVLADMGLKWDGDTIVKKETN